jgi:hypothetical protein
MNLNDKIKNDICQPIRSVRGIQLEFDFEASIDNLLPGFIDPNVQKINQPLSEKQELFRNSESLNQLMDELYEESHTSFFLEEKCNEFDPRFKRWEREFLIAKGISGKIANEFNKRFTCMDILYLIKEECLPSQANSYPIRIKPIAIPLLMANNISGIEVKRYDKRFSMEDIIEFSKTKIDSSTANAYQRRFTAKDIITLYGWEVPTTEASGYFYRFNAWDICSLFRKGIIPSTISKTEQRMAFQILKEIAQQSNGGALDNEENTVLHTNSRGIVIREITDVKKYSHTDITNERQVIYDINQANPHLENIVKLTDYEKSIVEDLKTIGGRRRIKERFYGSFIPIPLPTDSKTHLSVHHEFSMQYVTGEPIRKLVEENYVFNLDQLITITNGIIDGLIGIRRAGYYHCDLHDGNIIIDTSNNKAVIIDFGTAVDDPNFINPLNRSYGGNNDLISLGQIMYKMTTGTNLFNEARGFTCYSDIKDEIKTQREKVYEDASLKQMYLSRIKKEIPNTFGLFIASLLDQDLWTQPELEEIVEAKDRLTNLSNN